MGMTRIRAGAMIVGAVSAVVLLAGCTSGEIDAPSSPSPPTVPSSEPTSGASPTPDSPVTELGVDCAGLLTADTAAAVDPAWVPRDHYDRDTVEPADYAIAQEGGLSCAWNDGSPTDGKNNATGGGAYSGLLVQALPHAEETWPRFVEIYGDDPDGRCYEDQGYRGCTYDGLVGGTWVSIDGRGFPSVDGATADEIFAPIVAEVRSVIGAVDVLDEPWPLGGPPRPWSCVPDATLERDVFGAGDDLFVLTPGGGWSVYAAAWSRAVATSCSVLEGTTPYSSESVLVGGAWALDQRIEFDHLDPDTAVDVPELAAGDRAYRSCSATSCVTDLVLGDDWVRLTVLPEAVVDAEAASGRLAEAYVARATASA